MNLKQLNFPDNLKPTETSFHNKTDNPKSLDLTADTADTSEVSENQFRLQLQEMERLNTHLEKLIKDRTKENKEVVAANSKFISIIAHDLRGPFCSIIGALELLKEKLEHHKIKDIDNCIKIASNSASNTLELLDDLLTWAISQNKAKNFDPVKINLHELLRDKIEGLTILARQKRITLNHSIPPNLSVTADLQMVKTILRNLISNAIKYTNTGGIITISATEIAPFVEIMIKDNGIGISYQAQAELFKKNTFHSTSGTNNEKGTGLGLLLCKEFVEMHGGTIRLESEPGNGCEFRFALPHYI